MGTGTRLPWDILNEWNEIPSSPWPGGPNPHGTWPRADKRTACPNASIEIMHSLHEFGWLLESSFARVQRNTALH